jgi:hypothetical protein
MSITTSPVGVGCEVESVEELVWLAVLELLEPTTKVNVTVGAVN